MYDPNLFCQRSACECFEKLKLPYRLRTFPSGVVVVEGAQQKVMGQGSLGQKGSRIFTGRLI